MRKPKLLALLLSGFLITAGLMFPQAAIADPQPTPSQAGSFTAASDDDDESEDDEGDEADEDDSFVPTKPLKPKHPKFEDDEDGESDDEFDSESGFTTAEINELRSRYGTSGSMEVPTLIVKPRPYDGVDAETGLGVSGDEPEQGKSIDLKEVTRIRESPAVEFIEKAQVGLVAMGAGALALGAVATNRALRARRSKTEDYFYGESD